MIEDYTGATVGQVPHNSQMILPCEIQTPSKEKYSRVAITDLPNPKP